MAKSKRPQQKRIGQSQPSGVNRAQNDQAAKTNVASKAGASSAASQADAATTVSATKASADAASSPSRLSAIRANAATSATAGRATATAAKPVARQGSGGSGGSGLAKRPPQKRFARPPWWRRNLGAVITVGSIIILLGGIITYMVLQNQAAAAGIGDPVPASVMKELTGVPDSVFSEVGSGSVAANFAGGQNSAFQAAPPSVPPLTSNGMPEIIYVGAEYCPYCAAERWGTVVALSRFGSFSGLTLMRSSPTDSYANTPTLSFRGATYTSQYIVFNATETQDRNSQPIATPPSDIMAYFSAFDQGGSIPFMSYGNQYYSVGAPFFPTMMSGQNWQQVADQLKNPKSDTAQAIIGSANYQTAAICKITKNKPGSVCDTPVIQQLEANLPVAK